MLRRWIGEKYDGVRCCWASHHKTAYQVGEGEGGGGGEERERRRRGEEERERRRRGGEGEGEGEGEGKWGPSIKERR